jgi:hypothetical protein
MKTRIVSRDTKKIKPSKNHTIYLNNKSEVVPSVTTVLDVFPKKGLIQWANSLGWKRKSVATELNNAANWGTESHNTIESILLGHRDCDIWKYIREFPVANSVRSFSLWYEKNRDHLEVIHIEHKMSSKKYGGTADLICKYKDKLTIIDFKTSKDFYFTMFVQLAAYAKLYEKESGEDIENICVLRLDKLNGEEAQLKSIKDIKHGNIKYYYKVFKEALRLYNSIHVLESDWKG